MTLKNPTHPGEHILYDCLEPLGLSITAGAAALGISRWKLSEIVHCRAPVTPEVAIRLEKAFGSTVRSWLLLQAYYDIAQAERRADEIEVKRCVKAA